MQDGAMHSMLEKLLEWQELPTNAMDRVEELIHDVSAVKKPRLESSPAYRFAQPQPIVIASFSNHPGDTIGRNLIAALEKSYYDEGTTPIDWLRNVQAYWIISNLDDSIEKYDSTKLLAFLTREVKPQPFVAQDVVDMFHNLQGTPESVSDVQRTMVLDSTSKPLVFGQWIENSVDIKVTDQLFLAWLEYFKWHWRLPKSNSLLRYARFLKALRGHFWGKNLNEIILIRWTWRTDHLLRKKVCLDLVFPKLYICLHESDKSDCSAMLWILNYVYQYRKHSTFTDIKLISMEIPADKKPAEDMLQSMFSSTTMLTTSLQRQSQPAFF
ncbi:hypothetical protein Plhal304r1_c031g0101441 [Plasmopara halstedii]